MPEVSQAQLMNQLKKKAKGAWSRARGVEAKARSGDGGFPPRLKGLVAQCSSYAFKATQKGDPFFQLNTVVLDPPEFKDRKAVFMWFINESQWATVEDNLAQMSNDLQLLGKDMPEELDEVPNVLKELCDEGAVLVFNTGGPRKGDKSPNLFIQGLAQGEYDSDGDSGTDPGDDSGDGDIQEDEASEVDDNSEGDGDDGGDNGGTAEEASDFTPSKGDVYGYMHKANPKAKAKKINLEVTAVDTKKSTLAGRQVDNDGKPVKGGVQVKNLKYAPNGDPLVDPD